MKNWRVELIPEAAEDFRRLDGSVRKRVLKQFVKLERDPHIGLPFGKKAGIDLEGYFKIYVDKKRIRIVYQIDTPAVIVIAVDRREDMEVYRIASKRILSRESTS